MTVHTNYNLRSHAPVNYREFDIDETDDEMTDDEEYEGGDITEDDWVRNREYREPRQTGKKRKREADVYTSAQKIARRSLDTHKTIEDTENCIIGRDLEVRQMIRMLAYQRNGARPLLIAPAGIGKTSIVAKFAKVLKHDHVPPNLKDRAVVKIDCKALLSHTDTSKEGFGERFRSLIHKQKKSSDNPIYYLQDIDDLLNADDAVKVIFQTFLRSNVPCIASVSESKISEEAQRAITALSRFNFHPLYIEEVTKEETKEILQTRLEHYPLPDGMTVTEEAIQLAVNLADVHLKTEPFPRKAIRLIHEAANEVWMRNHETKGRIGKESTVVDCNDVAHIMEEKTGIPKNHLAAADWKNLMHMESRLQGKLVGQDDAIKTFMQAIKRYKMGYRDHDKPWGAFLSVGPTGVGKTELSKLIADELFKDKKGFIRIDMTEYTEDHSVSKLIGAPPGYVGYDAGGQLCNKVRETPHCVILLDEIEKAHKEVANIFLQVLDDGRLTDTKGNTVDFSHALIIMTSNLGAKTVFSGNQNVKYSVEEITEYITPLITDKWSPEFFGRLTGVVPFQNLTLSDYPKLIEVHLRRTANSISAKHHHDLIWTDAVVEYFLRQATETRAEPRRVCRAVEREVFNALADAAMMQQIEPGVVCELNINKGKIVVNVRR